MRSALRLCFASATLLFILFSTLMLSTSASSNQETAIFSISEADYSMAQTYEAVLDAEEAGADVSGLLAQLTVGGEHLAEARVWFSLGDFDSASLLAGLCYDVAEEVRFEAEELRSEVYGSQVVGVFVKMSGSVVGVVVVVLLSFMVWRVFKRRYRKNVLGMKPEVVSGES